MILDFEGRNMSRAKHSDAEMMAAPKQAEEGRKVEDVAREMGASKHTATAGKPSMAGWW